MTRASSIRSHGLRTTVTAATAALIAACGANPGSSATPAEPTSNAVELGIFEPIAGRIVYESDCITRTCTMAEEEDESIWGIDPAATEPTPTQLPGQVGTPVGWSSDGTELLVISPAGNLIILHADGTKTRLPGPTLPELFGAAISPDASRVVYAALTEDKISTNLYAIDVDSGRTALLVEPSGLMVYQPSFSPDGTQIAYVDGGGDHSHSVWVVNADGSDPHMIVENEVISEMIPGHVFGLAWSPTGDRIALGLQVDAGAAIYTFAPNGTGFTRLIRDAVSPSWSPDGSQIAYKSLFMHPCPENPDLCWSEDLSGGLGVVDADGSQPHTFGLGGSGPWHPA
jgi:Tol biopolymer transport system component